MLTYFDFRNLIESNPDVFRFQYNGLWIYSKFKIGKTNYYTLSFMKRTYHNLQGEDMNFYECIRIGHVSSEVIYHLRRGSVFTPICISEVKFIQGKSPTSTLFHVE